MLKFCTTMESSPVLEFRWGLGKGRVGVIFGLILCRLPIASYGRKYLNNPKLLCWYGKRRIQMLCLTTKNDIINSDRFCINLLPTKTPDWNYFRSDMTKLAKWKGWVEFLFEKWRSHGLKQHRTCVNGQEEFDIRINTSSSWVLSFIKLHWVVWVALFALVIP